MAFVSRGRPRTVCVRRERLAFTADEREIERVSRKHTHCRYFILECARVAVSWCLCPERVNERLGKKKQQQRVTSEKTTTTRVYTVRVVWPPAPYSLYLSLSLIYMCIVGGGSKVAAAAVAAVTPGCS